MKNVSLISKNIIKDILVLTEQHLHKFVENDAAAIFHLSSGGSRTRAKICVHAGIQLGLDTNDIICCASAIELLHNASLVHDDLQDGDEVRRGQPAVWKKFGQPRAICTGDAMINAAYAAIADIKDVHTMRAALLEMTKAVGETVQGQTMDLDKEQIIDSKQYEEIAARKSGPLFRLALSMPMILSHRFDLLDSVNYIAAKFAIAYQIHDDMGDYQSDKGSNTLNIVSLLANQSSDEDAMFIAKNRVKYLLMMCQKELALLPNNCALEVRKVAEELIQSVERNY
ncbi:polyprenyl synthetase family protein [Glaciecola petra]|uniref:Polyprenyl synthetase family protein n=1 Tax=Glaciecola petra TaxID=3075602 RepID=A0ABU2ZQ54_9ALTE|nr:polyprenyl synthetase family protein [Aestuariibacter sp. P117]MDT0594748.1 polyprenyl synthetase family protein [Aestuariibacter sp. P117]